MDHHRRLRRRAEGEVDWILGDQQLAAYELAAVADRDTLLFGRSTYEDYAGYWSIAASSSENGFERDHGRNMTATPKVVVSLDAHRSRVGRHRHSQVPRRRPPAQAAEREGDPHLRQPQPPAPAVRPDLVDEYQLLVHPVALGGGTSLFTGLSSRLALTLVDQQRWDSGISLLTYRQGRA